jgi:hypothetical protein
MKRYFYPLLLIAAAALTIKAYRLARKRSASAAEIDPDCFKSPVAEIKDQMAEAGGSARSTETLKTHVDSVVRSNLADAGDDEEFQDRVQTPRTDAAGQ